MTQSNTLKNAVLDAIFNNTALQYAAPYVSLHTGDPGTTGASEVAGGSYARQALSAEAAANGATQNDAAITFTGMPAVTVTHFGIWSALAGSYLWGGVLGASKTTQAGDEVRFNNGDLDLSYT